jgi:CRP-like cAMP-binding protein
MLSQDDLRPIVMLKHLTEPMLEKLARIVDLLRFDKDEVVFRQNEPAQRFHMLRLGKVLLELRMSEKVTVCVGSIRPGYSFGWSAMLEGGTYSTDAICSEPTECLSFRKEKVIKLFQQDPEMGFRMYQRFLVMLKKRYDDRTEQFRLAIMNHPDMQNLFSFQL